MLHARSGRQPALAVVAGALAVVLALTLLTAPGAAAGQERTARVRADLVVTALSVPTARLVPGAAFRVTDTTRNAGRRLSPRTRTAYFLSTDNRRDRADVALGSRSVRSLKPRHESTARTSLTVPILTGPGSYRLIACADGRSQVEETRERNNCRVAKVPLRVGPPTDTVDVTPVGAPDGAVTQTVGRAGGTLVSTHGGTTFTLSIPAGALLRDRTITMTPLAEVRGLPFASGLVAGVDLGPEGLRLDRPARLQVSSPALPPVERQAVFAATGSGRDLHLAPTSRSTDDLEVPLVHFSTYGVATSTPAERTALASSTPRSPEARVEGQVGELDQLAREGALSADEQRRRQAEVLRLMYDTYFFPMLLAAHNDARILAGPGSQLLAMLTWLRGSMHLPGIGERYFRALKLLESALRAGIRRASDSCVASQDPGFGSDLVLYKRVFDSVFFAGHPMPSVRVDDEMARCVRRVYDRCVETGDQALGVRLLFLYQDARTLNVHPPAPDEDEIRRCAAGTPDGYRGTVSTVVDYDNGTTQTFEATVEFDKFEDDSHVYYGATRGTMDWTVSGTFSSGCTIDGSYTFNVYDGPYAPAAVIRPYEEGFTFDPGESYGVSGFKTAGEAPNSVTITCSDPPSTRVVESYGYDYVSWFTTTWDYDDSWEVLRDGSIAGAYEQDIFAGGSFSLHTDTEWDLRPFYDEAGGRSAGVRARSGPAY